MKEKRRKQITGIAILVLLPILVFALVCIFRINRHVWDYPYSKELGRPGIGVDLKYDDIFTDLYIRWCNLVDRGQTTLWKAPEGIVKKPMKVTARDGFQIGGYILEPEGCEDEKLPAMLYCHGGAFFLEMMGCQLDLGAVYAQELHCRVFLPEYRTSLDYPYPAPLYDCYDTLKMIAWSSLTDTERVMIYGDSAGGCLAAEVTHLCCDEQLLLPAAQMLIYPVTDTSQEYASLKEYEYATWPAGANRRMWKLYLHGHEPTAQDYAVPMLHDSFQAYPKTYVEGAEMDTLYDQALAYAEKMSSAGVDVTLKTIDGAYHGFDGDVRNAFVQTVIGERISWLESALNPEEIS